LNHSQTLIRQWQSVSLGQNYQLLSSYTNDSSWSLGYNLFLDRWLKTSIVYPPVFDAQSQIIGQQLMSIAPPSTLPVDSADINVTTPYWSAFAASVVTNTSVGEALMTRVQTQFMANSTLFFLSGSANGAVFAPLALQISPKTFTAVTTSSSSKTNSRLSVGLIAGVAGGAASILAILSIAACVWRRHIKRPAQGYLKRKSAQTYSVWSRKNDSGIFTVIPETPGSGEQFNQYKQTSAGLVLGPAVRSGHVHSFIGTLATGINALTNPHPLPLPSLPLANHPLSVLPSHEPGPSRPSTPPSAKSLLRHKYLEEELSTYNHSMLVPRDHSHLRSQSGSQSLPSVTTSTSDSVWTHGPSELGYSKEREREMLKREMDTIMMHLDRLDASPPSYYDQGITWAV